MQQPDLNKITTSDDLLAALRGGHSQEIKIGLHAGYMVPCRLLSALEEVRIIANATAKARRENLMGEAMDKFIGLETMYAVLRECTSINGAVGIPQATLEKLSVSELDQLYDQYISLNKTINPNFQNLTVEEINSLIESIRQKKTLVKGCFMWQLAEVGKYCLEEMLRASPTDKGVGSR